MPPRIITAAILAFWLAMSGLLIHREVVPMMLADVSPVFQPDLTDEIGADFVRWDVLHDGDQIGEATSKVHSNKLPNNDDHSFEFRSTFRFHKLAFGFDQKKQVHVRQMENMYRVSHDGKLLAVSTKIAINNDPNKQPFEPPDHTISIHGEVINGGFEPTVDWNGLAFKLDKAELPRQESVVNPMQLINRMRGLRVGQTWRVKPVDAFQAAAEKFLGDIGQKMKVPALIAKVTTGELEWNKREVACLVIEYRNPDTEVIARTWVRRSDGLVLQQEARNLASQMISRRKPG